MAEFSLIQRYFQSKTLPHGSTHLGIGDDCAISHIPTGVQLVSCVDTLIAGRHFPLHTSAHAIGWKSVAVNLSDLAAMGATPYAILLALSLPHVEEEWLQAFSQGLADCCHKYGVQLIGGDTTQSPTLTISITALGWVKTGHAICRSGANIGDYICVSGTVGDASLALISALKQESSPVQTALDYPQPQLQLGQQLQGYASAMIDISDGLAQDLGHILQASQVGAVLTLETLPTSETLKHYPLTEQWHHQLTGGDDYQLCFCISPKNYQQFCKTYQYTPCIIGQITSSPELILTYHGQRQHLNLKGYQHFE